jgi:hypothetical protein
MPINLVSKIKPKNNGQFPTYDDIDGYGGFQVRGTTTDRDSIPVLNRKAGMLVYVQANSTYYQLGPGLTNSDWIVSSLGATGAAGPQGPQGSPGITGPAGGLTGIAGGSLTGTYPNPLVVSITGDSNSNVPIIAAQTTLNSNSLVPMVRSTITAQSNGTSTVQLFAHPDQTATDFNISMLARGHTGTSGNLWRGDFLFTSHRFNGGSGVGTGVQMLPTGPIQATNVRQYGPSATGTLWNATVQATGTNIYGVVSNASGVADWSILLSAQIRS